MTYERYFKRGFDLATGGLLLIAGAIPLAIVALLVRLKLGSPIIFRQQRPGRHGRPFMMCKFRTMTDERDAEGNLLPDEQRMTRFGNWLRKTSLDELPELWNVIRGDMSLIGPRPLLMKYLPRYSDEQRRRHEVRPGVTGWAQVNGRNAIEWEQKFALDVWYVDHVSFWLDMSILFLTASAVLRQSDINKPGHATTTEFMGGVVNETPVHQVARNGYANSDKSGVIVLGAGGHAKVVISTLRAAGEQVVAVFDDRAELWGTTLLGVPIVGRISASQSFGVPRAVIAIGDNTIRRQLANQLSLDWISVIHPRAWVDDSVQLGDGSVVMAGAVIQPDAIIGSHVIVNTAASVDHDGHVCDFVHIGPGTHLSGNVTVRAGAFLGTGTSVIQGRKIGEDAMVGAGSVVIRDIPAHATAVGCPAKVIRIGTERLLRKSA